MVERKVKPISTQASPSVTKMMSVCQIADGCDQKKALIIPVVAAISQAAMMTTRMPNCVATMAQVGQSFCTGSRRTGLAVGLAVASADASRARSRSPRPMRGVS